MTSRDVLFDICDFENSYLGCSNRDSLATVDLVFCYLTGLTILLNLIYLVVGNTLKKKQNRYDRMVVLLVLSSCLRLGSLLSYRDVGLQDREQLSNESLQSLVRRTLFINFFQYRIASVAFKLFMEGVAGINVLTHDRMIGRVVNIGKILSLAGYASYTAGTVCIFLFAFLGVGGSLEQFLLWRTFSALTPAFFVLFIIIPVYSSYTLSSIHHEGHGAG
ncbi:hypothetical protein HDU91_002612 [Kappamyces sp. JEL0680]|nr:hypothetical protein HDU91_002612 [Kappamyces sp. JEL0680]